MLVWDGFSMREIFDIVAAFEALCAAGKPAALATVVGVEGSSYRRPGARMLVAEDGRTWGGVSGGCLERDVAARGRGVIATGRPIICRYDTGDDEVPSLGATTGCGGVVELLLQPVSAQAPGALPMLARVLKRRETVSIATVVRASGALAGSEGTCLATDEDTCNSIVAGEVLASAGEPARVVQVRTADGTAEVFVERLVPPQALVIFGAGPDAAPMVTIAKTLGWHVTVVGTRPASGMAERFPAADRLAVTASDDPTEGVDMPGDCAVLVMTHNLARDRAILGQLPRELRYLGILGPRHRTARLLSEIPANPVFREAFTPMGLDLGAQTPEEIALSVTAEIQAVVRQAAITPLRERPGPIHPRAGEGTSTSETIVQCSAGSACAG